MENITTSTTTEQIPKITEPLENYKKYFRQRDTARLYLFFGPIAGTYALYKNSKTLGKMTTAKLFLRGGLLYSLLLTMVAISVESIPEGLFPFLHAIGGYFYYEYNQKNSIAYELSKGSSYYSRWESFGFGILLALVFFVVFIIGLPIVGFLNPQDIGSNMNTGNVNIGGVEALYQTGNFSETN